MKLTFLGAAHEVTGSKTLIECNGNRILVDCGMEQGRDIFENQELPVSPTVIDCVLLTHAHIDHSGNLPLLSRGGFRGPVYATRETCNLSAIMLRDSTHIQMFEAEWRNRKAKRGTAAQYVPLYDMADTERILSKMVPVPYGQWRRILDGVEIRMTDVGHLLGSAAIEVRLTEDGVTRTVVFSGDIGNTNRPIVRDPLPVAHGDFVVVESTYGDRLHEKKDGDPVKLLADIIGRTLARGGNVVIPGFAVGRTQEILYYLRRIRDEKMFDGADRFPVYMDSPLAGEATRIFVQSDVSALDSDAARLVRTGVNPFWFDGLTFAESAEQSKAINNDPRPKVIISASGMCEAGRIRHHLKHNLWRRESTLLFVGYQSPGTLGRILYDGARHVRLFGEQIEVNAEIALLPGVSGHADREGLIGWLRGFRETPRTVFVNHGEDEVTDRFAKTLTELGIPADAPYSGAVYDLLAERYLSDPDGIRKAQKKTARAKTVHQDLVDAAEDLLAYAKSIEGRPNKELSALASQIRALLQKSK